MSVISSTWGFVKRHKGKIFLLGTAVGGYYYLNQILSSAEKNWEKSASKDFVAEVRKKETHFENSVQTANTTCNNLVPNILDILDDVLNPGPIIKSLKCNKNDLDQWKNLTVVIFTRAVSEVYSICLFVCYLRVQLLVIAGYIYVDSVASGDTGSNLSMTGGTFSSSSTSSMNQSIQLKYLSLLNTFYVDGIHEIMKPVQDAVRAAIDDLNIKQKITVKDLENIFEKIRLRMSFTLEAGDASRFLLSSKSLSSDSTYGSSASSTTSGSSTSSPRPTASSPRPDAMESKDSIKLSAKDSKALETLMNETQDLLEQDDFMRTLNRSIEVAFSYLLDQMVTCFQKPMTDSMNGSISGPSSLSSESSNGPTSMVDMSMTASGHFTNPSTVAIELAKLLPKMREVLYDRSKRSKNDSLVRQLLCLDILNCYSANVYEAFCDTNKCHSNVKK